MEHLVSLPHLAPPTRVKTEPVVPTSPTVISSVPVCQTLGQVTFVMISQVSFTSAKRLIPVTTVELGMWPQKGVLVERVPVADGIMESDASYSRRVKEQIRVLVRVWIKATETTFARNGARVYCLAVTRPKERRHVVPTVCAKTWIPQGLSAPVLIFTPELRIL